ERQRIQESLARTNDQLAIGAQRLIDCIRLIADPATLYVEGSDELRRNLNLTFFRHFYVDDDETVRVSESVFQEPYGELNAAGELFRAAMHERSPVPGNGASSVSHATQFDVDLTSLDLIRTVSGSSKTEMVGPVGLEPTTNGLKVRSSTN
ncbi:MAG: prophage integrase, partial [Jatrophihabitans sp.]|nr:prophage integrase [Jatrophihabitans sp.]